MPEPSRLRDSTQIILSSGVLDDLRAEIDARFTVTVVPVDDHRVRIVGSPVEIKEASDFLSRHGISIP